MNRRTRYEVRREVFELLKNLDELDREGLIGRLNKVTDLVEEAFGAKWDPPLTLKAPLKYYSRVLDADAVDTGYLAKAEDDFTPCFAGEEIPLFTWYFGDLPFAVHDGDEVHFILRGTGEIISRGHVTGSNGDWAAEMEHPAGTYAPCDFDAAADIDLIIRTQNN